MNPIRIVLAVALLAAISLPINSAFAQSDAAYIQYRQKVMSSMGGNIGAIGIILKEKLPLKENIAKHALAIHEDAKIIATAFKHKAYEGMTDAKEKIWREHGEFREKIKKLETESAKLAKVAAGGDMSAILAQVKKTGGACGACHKEYRKPKEESYKNKKM